MLKMKTRCERCGNGLAADAAATICSFECTFCPDCAEALRHVCPNCDGELLARPRRLRKPLPVAADLAGRRLRGWFGKA